MDEAVDHKHKSTAEEVETLRTDDDDMVTRVHELRQYQPVE